MTVTPDTLRAVFTEFADKTAFPDPFVQFWLTNSAGFVNEARWGDQTDFGITLRTCHFMAMNAQPSALGAKGKPGQVKGLLTNKSVDGVTAAYDVSSVTIKDAGHWNMTKYGIQFRDLLRMMGAGPVEIGFDQASLVSASAWPGVLPSPF